MRLGPAKVAVASRLRLKPDCKCLTTGPARIVLFTTEQTPESQLAMLQESKAEVYVLGERRANLTAAMHILNDMGIQRLMLERGATLNSEMLQRGLVDELTVFVGAVIFGGETAPTLAGGGGLEASAAIALELVQSQQWEDGGVLLRYRVKGNPPAP